MAIGLDTALGEELDADYWPSTALFLFIDSSFATMAQGRVAAVFVHASALTARHNNALLAVGIGSCGGRGPSLADSVRGPEGHPGGDRRRQVLMLTILTADPALHLAARRNYLTGPLFWQIVARIERLARHPT